MSQTRILTEKDLTLALSGDFEEEGLNMAVCPKPELNLGFFGDLEEMHSSALQGSQREA